MEKTEHIKALDGVRGFAALLVLYGHTSGVFGLSSLTGVPVVAKSGVYLFFVLSAYLLGKQFMELQMTRGAVSDYLPRYFYRRFARIVPLYLFGICSYYAVSLLIPGKSLAVVDFRGFVSALFMYKASGHFWTIPVEFIFYFILPVFALLYDGSKDSAQRTSLIYFIFIVLSVAAFDPQKDQGLIPLMFVFVCGIWIALVDVHCSHPRGKLWQVFIGLVSILCAATYFFVYPVSNSWWAVEMLEVANYRALWAFLASLLVLTVLWGGKFSVIFESRILCYIGKISYSLYIWHMLVYYAVKVISPFGASNLTVLSAWVLAIVAGHISYVIFEVHVYRSVRLKRLWSMALSSLFKV